MENLPWNVPLTFGVTFLTGLWLFAKAASYSKSFLSVVVLLIIIQSALGLLGFYNDVKTMSAKFPLLLIPSLAICVLLFFTRKGKAFIDSLDIKTLTILHVIRIGVELVLLWLFINKAIPKAMTFEGRNFDILSGITAPLVYYFSFVKHKLNRQAIIIWNVACMLLLINVVFTAVLSLPAKFQHFGFEQPNIALGYFPFLLLPSVLVPLVLFTNAAAIRQLIINKNFITKK